MVSFTIFYSRWEGRGRCGGAGRSALLGAAQVATTPGDFFFLMWEDTLCYHAYTREWFDHSTTLRTCEFVWLEEFWTQTNILISIKFICQGKEALVVGEFLFIRNVVKKWYWEKMHQRRFSMFLCPMIRFVLKFMWISGSKLEKMQNLSSCLKQILVGKPCDNNGCSWLLVSLQYLRERV